MPFSSCLQTVIVKSASGKEETYPYPITILPAFTAVKASPGVARGVIAGETIGISMDGPLPSGIDGRQLKVTLEDFSGQPLTNRPALEGAQDKQLIVRIPTHIKPGRYILAISSVDAMNQFGQTFILQIEKRQNILLSALAPIIVVIVVIVILCYRRASPLSTMSGYNWLQLLFMEEQTKTYSLSRAQFICWSAAIGISYVFIFFARGLVESIWAFPPLSGFAYIFLISLGTLVAAQATSAARGTKGAGPEEPQISDLIVHGGVLALERVQQVLWTVIGIFMFLWITYKNYATATALPTIPDEMLALMGISSAGYIGGKMVRKPGPVIKQIQTLSSQGNVIIKIFGDNLSKDAFVWVDGVQQPKDVVSVLEVDATAQKEFATALQVSISTPSGLRSPPPTVPDWFAREHTIVVVNADGQRAEENITVPKIHSALPSVADGMQILNIAGEDVLRGANVSITNAGGVSVKSVTQDQGDPNKLTAVLDGTLPGTYNVTVTNPDNQYAIWKSK